MSTRLLDPRVRVGPVSDPWAVFSARADGSSFEFELAGGAEQIRARRESSPSRMSTSGARATRADPRRLHLSYRREAVRVDHPYLRPQGDAGRGLEDVRTGMVALDAVQFRAQAEQVLGRPLFSGPVACPSRGLTLLPDRAHLVHSAIDYLFDVVADGDAIASPLLRKELFRMVGTVLLTAFELVDPTGDDANKPPLALRRALAHIDANLAHPVALAGIAKAARMSERGVQRLFTRELGRSPLEIVRERRLKAARRALQRSDAAITTVAAVARDCGFTHLGRFARAYAEAFGETPSSTLRS